MTVKQLRKELEKYPDNMDVFVDERITEFTYGLINSVDSKKINFMEDPRGKPLSRGRVVILREE